MIRILSVLAVCFVALANAGTCDASVAIRLDDLAGNVMVITDNGPDDLNPTLGAVTWTGSLGAGSWTVNTTTGLGTPVLGNSNFPHTDLNSVNVTGSAGILELALTQTDNNQLSQPIAFNIAVGGVAGRTFDAAIYVNSDNLPFSTTGAGAVQIGTLGPFTAGAFSGTTTGSALGVTTGSGMYSLTTVATISHPRGANITSFDLELNTIPEPASVAAWTILGALGLGLAWFKRRR